MRLQKNTWGKKIATIPNNIEQLNNPEAISPLVQLPKYSCRIYCSTVKKGTLKNVQNCYSDRQVSSMNSKERTSDGRALSTIFNFNSHLYQTSVHLWYAWWHWCILSVSYPRRPSVGRHVNMHQSNREMLNKPTIYQKFSATIGKIHLITKGKQLLDSVYSDKMTNLRQTRGLIGSWQTLEHTWWMTSTRDLWTWHADPKHNSEDIPTEFASDIEYFVVTRVHKSSSEDPHYFIHLIS